MDPPSSALPQNRFELELEFVQSLASPAYLHYLATSGTLYQESFLDFLRYLRYWKRPEYAKYLSYPNCLYFLDLLVPPDGDGRVTEEDSRSRGRNRDIANDSGDAFRREMAQVPFRNFVHEQQFYSWQYRAARLYGKGLDKKSADQAAIPEGSNE